MSKAHVRRAQTYLKNNGCKITNIDGRFGKETEAAIYQLGEKAGLKQKDNMILEQPQSANFVFKEFRCRNGEDVPPEFYSNLTKLLEVLEMIRSEYGGMIEVVSGYRTQEYNDNLPDYKNEERPTRSMHILAGAADIRALGSHNVKALGVIAKRLYDEGIIGGLVMGLDFIHIDLRNVIPFVNDNYFGFYNDIKSYDEWLQKAS